MMKNITIAALFTASLFVSGCKSKDNKPKEKEENLTTRNEVGTAEEKPVTPSNPEIRDAALGYCECFNKNFKTVDPKIQKIFIKATESTDPLMVLQQELFNITDPVEQQHIGEEMVKISDSKEMQICNKELQQKYKFDENDKATQQQVLKALEGNKDCKLVAALIQIGLKRSEMESNNPRR